MKVFIMTTPCSGKSFTIRNQGLDNLIDSDRLKRVGKIKKEDAEKMIEAVPEGYILMGKPHEPYLKKCKYLSILIPEDELNRYIEKRKKKKGKRWNSFEKIDLLRQEIKRISKQYNIPIFTSYKEAICEAKKYI